MKKVLLFIILVQSCSCFAQNSIWTIAPNYLTGIPTPLPVNSSGNNPLDPYDFYDGWAARQGSNAMQDINGNLRFFIVDGVIYDETGKYADYAWSAATPPTYTQDPITMPFLNV